MATNFMSPTQALELVAESKIEQEQTKSRTLARELTSERAKAPNNPVGRVLTAVTAAAVTTHADTMIGDGKGDGVKIGGIIGGAATAAVAWRTGHYTVAHAAIDSVIGIACAQTAITVRENGLKAALLREQKRAAAQAATK